MALSDIVDIAWLEIIERAVYDSSGNVVPGLAFYQIIASFDENSPVYKVLDSHWQESTSFECLQRWVARYEKLGYHVNVK